MSVAIPITQYPDKGTAPSASDMRRLLDDVQRTKVRGRGVGQGIHNVRIAPPRSQLARPVGRATMVVVPLTITLTAPDGWVIPEEEASIAPPRTYLFVTYGTLDGMIPSNITEHLVSIDMAATASAERMVYLKAVWTPPLLFDFTYGLVPDWDDITVEVTETFALNAGVFPPQPAIATSGDGMGWRPYFNIPIGRIQYIYTPPSAGVVASSRVVFNNNDTSGNSFISSIRSAYGSITASGGPTIAPIVNLTTQVIFTRNQ